MNYYNIKIEDAKNKNIPTECEDVLVGPRNTDEVSLFDTQIQYSISQEFVNRIKLVLAGRRGYGYEKVKKIIKEKGLENDIIELGWTDQEDLPYLLAGAELFTFLSFYEGFGIPVLEAMACGVPVLASDIPALREVASDVALFVNPNEPKEIADGILKLLSDEKLRCAMVKGGLEQAQKFSWEKCGRESLEVLVCK
ncbi:glycosyltransferase family 4 protein [Patescibacteria group bacterium]